MKSPEASPRIVGVTTGFPPNYYSQEELTAMLLRIWKEQDLDSRRLEKFHRNMQVQARHLALPMEEYEELDGFGASNEAWIRVAMQLSESVICQGLDQAAVPARDVAALVSTSVTGIAVPSIDARLMNRIPFSPALKRLPLFGLGCLGGAAGLARAADYLKGHPREIALLLSVELCSLTLQRNDLSMANLVSSGLFGDGAAVVLLAGADYPGNLPEGPAIVDTQSVFIPGTEEIMGYDIRDTGFKMILGANVNEVILAQLRPAVEDFLRQNQLEIDDVGAWLVHPGGPKILDAVEKALNLGPEDLQASRESLSQYGNVSSTSVLIVLEEFYKQIRPPSGTYGLLMAMGPAFCAELVLMKW